MIKSSKEFELLSRWALSLLDPGDFQAILIDDKAIEILLGKTTYSDLLMYDFNDDQEVIKSRRFVLEYLIHQANGLFQRYKAAFILDRMLSDPEEILPGLRNISDMASSGCDFIPVSFIGLDSETDTVPTNDQLPYWEESAFIKAQEPLNTYKEDIIQEAKALRSILKGEGI